MGGFLRSNYDYRIVRKRTTVPHTINNSIVLENTTLYFPAPMMTSWLVRWYLKFENASVNTDVNLGMFYPAGCTISWGVDYDSIAGYWKAVAVGSSPPALLGEASTRNLGGMAGIWGVTVTAIVSQSNVAAGDVGLRWAPNAAVVEDTTLYADSMMIAERCS